MKRKFGIKQEGGVDEPITTHPIYRKINEGEYEFIGFANGIRAEQVTESTRNWYQRRAAKAVLQSDMFDTEELLPV
jgi:hypothetical protein